VTFFPINNVQRQSAGRHDISSIQCEEIFEIDAFHIIQLQPRLQQTRIFQTVVFPKRLHRLFLICDISLERVLYDLCQGAFILRAKAQ